jgi:chromosome partitioning protein
MGILVLVGHEKGGVGKTTISVNLAAMCVLAGRDTLLVDTDKQESATSWASVRHENDIKPAITCVAKTGKVGFDLAKLKDKFDVIIVDAGGTDSIEMRQAMAVCDIFVLPVKPSQFDIWSMSSMSQLVKDVEERIDAKINAHVLINEVSPNPKVKETSETREALADYADVFQICSTALTQRTVFRRAAREGKCVLELSPSAADQKANQELISIFKEIFGEAYVHKA